MTMQMQKVIKRSLFDDSKRSFRRIHDYGRDKIVDKKGQCLASESITWVSQETDSGTTALLKRNSFFFFSHF
jgi:hypothetical protein